MRIPCHPEYTFPKPPKIKEKWYNISCESVPKWCKIKVWRGSGQLLGGSGGLLGISWLQGTSVPLPWRLLASFSAVLEVSWAPLGRLLGRLGHQVGASWGVLERSWRRLGRIFAPKWRQVGIKIYQIMDLMIKLRKR